MVLACLVLLIIYIARRHKIIALGSLWFLIGILPVLNIVPLTGLTIAERFLYLPSIGFALVLAGFLTTIKIVQLPEQLTKKVVFVFLLLIVGFNVFFTVLRNPVWHDEKKFFTTMVEQSPSSALAHHNLGYVLYREGNWIHAEAEYKKAIALNSMFPESHATLGDIFYKTGRLQEAIREYSTYLYLAPNASNRQQTLERNRILKSLLATDSQ